MIGNPVDYRMNKYVNTETKQVVVLMDNIESVGKFVRKDVWDAQQVNTVKPGTPATVKVEPAPATAPKK